MPFFRSDTGKANSAYVTARGVINGHLTGWDRKHFSHERRTYFARRSVANPPASNWANAEKAKVTRAAKTHGSSLFCMVDYIRRLQKRKTFGPVKDPLRDVQESLQERIKG